MRTTTMLFGALLAVGAAMAQAQGDGAQEIAAGEPRLRAPVPPDVGGAA